jgi:hypothetical protein
VRNFVSSLNIDPAKPIIVDDAIASVPIHLPGLDGAARGIGLAL